MKNLEYGIILQYLQNQNFPNSQKSFYQEVKQQGGLNVSDFLQQAQQIPTIDPNAAITAFEQILKGIYELDNEKDEILRKNSSLSADIIGLRRTCQNLEKSQQMSQELQGTLQLSKQTITELQEQHQNSQQQNQLLQQQVKQLAQTVQEIQTKFNEQQNIIKTFSSKDQNYQMLNQENLLKLEAQSQQLINFQQKNSQLVQKLQEMKEAIKERDIYIDQIQIEQADNVANMKQFEQQSNLKITKFEEANTKYNNIINNLQEQIEQLNVDNNIMSQQYHSSKIKIENMQNTIDQAQQLQNQVLHLNNQLIQQKDQNNNLETQIQLFKTEQIANQQTTMEHGNQLLQINDLSCQLQDTQQHYIQLQQENSQLKNELLQAQQKTERTQENSQKELDQQQLLYMQLQQQFQVKSQSFNTKLDELYQSNDTKLRDQLSQICSLTEQVTSFSSQKIKLEAQIISFTQLKVDSDLKIENSKIVINQFQLQIQDLESKVQDQIDANMKLDNQITLCKKNNENLQKEVDYFKTKSINLEKETQDIQNQLMEFKNLQNQLKRVKQELDIKENDNKSSQQHIDDLFSKNSDLSTQIFQVKMKDQDNMIKIQDLELQLQQFRQQANNITSNKEVIDFEEYQLCKNKNSKQKQQIDDLLDQIAKYQVIEVQFNSFKTQQQTYLDQRDKNFKHSDNLHQQVQQLENINQKLQNEIELLTSKQQQYEANQHVQQQLQQQAEDTFMAVKQQFQDSLQFIQNENNSLKAQILELQNQKLYLEDQLQYCSDQKELSNTKLSLDYNALNNDTPKMNLQASQGNMLVTEQKVFTSYKRTPINSVKTQCVTQCTQTSLNYQSIDEYCSVIQNQEKDIIKIRQQLQQKLDQEFIFNEQINALVSQKQELESFCQSLNTQTELNKQNSQINQSNISQEQASKQKIIVDLQQQIVILQEKLDTQRELEENLDLYNQCLQQKEIESNTFIDEYKKIQAQLVSATNYQCLDILTAQDIVTDLSQVAVQIFQLTQDNQQVYSLVNQILNSNQISEQDIVNGLVTLQQFIQSDQIQLQTLTKQVDEQQIELTSQLLTIQHASSQNLQLKNDNSILQNDAQAFATIQVENQKLLLENEQLQEIKQLYIELEQNTLGYKTLQEQNSSYAQKLADLADALSLRDCLKEQIFELQKELTSTQQNNNKLQQQLHIQLQQITSYEEKLVNLNTTEGKMKSALDENKQLIDKQTEQTHILNQQFVTLNDLKIKLEQGEQEMKTYNNQILKLPQLEQQLQQIQIQYNELQVKYTQANQVNQELSVQLQNLNSQVQIKQQENSIIMSSKINHNSNIQQLQSKINELQQQVQEQEQTNDFLKVQIRKNSVEFEKVVQHLITQKDNLTTELRQSQQQSVLMTNGSQQLQELDLTKLMK
ncbi:hypothetical protein SS50377_21256 [Spironucleus salmonicida]|uniref:LisH domain-containing protein n=1 Tax=Spironucleus salmonicida TaxID=348837 RepID=V6LHJ5_9EUKA|nr:hypothetical protein SS50377_21256 [Spironucleus salmonicida]|eukprot:EST44027.1 Hypothetical protein SS50377_16336 [Spironucleus salmonicida]